MVMHPLLKLAGARRIGILGGSFNPAHAGHVHISLAAQKALGLDEVWWMVSPHNPLKQKSDLLDYAERLAFARTITAPHPFIHVTDIESRLGTRYTADTLSALKRAAPRARFVWLMGSDNLSSIHRWRHWERIFALYPLLVLDRAPYSHAALRGKAAGKFAKKRILENNISMLADIRGPAWAYLHMRRHPGNATAIRKLFGKEGVFTHNTKTKA